MSSGRGAATSVFAAQKASTGQADAVIGPRQHHVATGGQIVEAEAPVGITFHVPIHPALDP